MVQGIFSDFLRNLIIKKTFIIEDDGINLFKNIKYSALSSKSLAFLFQEIGKAASSSKDNNFKTYLYDLGYQAGEDAAKEMKENMLFKNKIFPYRARTLQLFMEMIGFGNCNFIDYNPKEKRILVHVSNHPVLLYSKELFGNDSMVCNYYLGVYTAHASNELEITGARGIETQCVCKGSPFCEWSFNYFKENKSLDRIEKTKKKTNIKSKS
ncbi:MAG: hypothetical protein QXJ28_01095 [Candidatus Pacearchaeota archaeon]